MRTPSTLRYSALLFLRLSTAGLILTLAASCRSSQSAYQFRAPAPVVAVAAASVVSEEPVVAAVLPQSAHKQTAEQGINLVQRPLVKRHLVRPQLRRAVAQAVQSPRRHSRLMPTATQRVRHTSGPRQTSEVGLGTTVLGVLGLVVLPISLIGLLIWGGPVWLILAALSGLAVLVAYLDPFG